jgi:tetratricopeptide (TPR) repeat protein
LKFTERKTEEDSKVLDKFNSIKNNIEKGCKALEQFDHIKGCDYWLAAWEEIKTLMKDYEYNRVHNVDGLFMIEHRLILPVGVQEYVQDLEMELGNAGLEDKDYYRKRIKYCRELLERCTPIGGYDRIMVENTKRAIAQSYFQLGEHEASEQEFESMLNDDPTFGWAYIEWADCYAFGRDATDYNKAYEIIDRGLNQPGLRDRKDVLDRAIYYCGEQGNKEKKIYYKSQPRSKQKK